MSDLPVEVAARLWPELVAHLRKYNVEIARDMGIQRGEVFRLADYMAENHPPTLEELLGEDEEDEEDEEDVEGGRLEGGDDDN